MTPKQVSFAGAVGLQLALLAAAPLTRIDALTAGTLVTLETAPVDPYDPLAGYYVTLGYAVEREAGRALDGYEGRLWLVVAADTPGWRYRRWSETRPSVGPDEAALPAVARSSRVRIEAASRLYISESVRFEIDEAMRAAKAPPLVDLSVGRLGSVIVRRLRVGRRVYGQ